MIDCKQPRGDAKETVSCFLVVRVRSGMRDVEQL